MTALARLTRLFKRTARAVRRVGVRRDSVLMSAPKRAVLEELEPRILHSADLAPALLDGDALVPVAQVRLIETTVSASTGSAEQSAAGMEQVSTELVFIDSSVRDVQRLVDDMRAEGRPDADLEVVTIESGEDGLARIAETLRGRTGVDAIHLIGHGSEGRMMLGNSMLDGSALQDRQAEIAGWAAALSDGADILLYGCGVAASETGQTLVDDLARLTGADVAASDDLTGQTLLGGDWNLEYSSGHIDAVIALSAEAQSEWNGLLAITANGTVTSTSTTNATSLTWAHTVSAGTDRVLFVELAIDGLGAPATSVTYGGAALTRVGRATGNHAVEIWRLVNPTVGTADVVATFSGSTAAAGGATTFNGVNQLTPTGTFVGATGTGTTASVNVASAVGDLVIDTQYWSGIPSGGAVGAGQTLQWSLQNASMTGGSTTEAGAATVTMSGSFTSSAQWEIGAVSIRAAPSAPVNTVPGAQSTNEDTTRVFSSANGNAISISDADAGGASNEVTLSVTNGSLTLSGTANLTFASGDGVGDGTMTFRGTAGAINTALDGLIFTPTVNYNGSATLTLSTKDSTLVSLNIDTSLKGRYAFENTGALGTDTSPASGYPGTVSGAMAVNDATRGNVLSLAGAGYVQTSGHFGDSTSVTLAAWVNLTAADSGGADVISLGDALALRLDSGGKMKGYMWNGSAYVFTESVRTLAGTGWHHVAYTVDNATKVHAIYLDGVQIATTTQTTSVSYTIGANSFIGTHGNGGTTTDFNGKIDDARIYSRALTSTEIGTLATDLSMTDTDTVAITVVAVADAPTANAGGPYTIAEGGSLTLNGAASSDPDGGVLTYAWDLDNDGLYGEAGEPATAAPTVSWATLQSLGINDDGSYTIGLRVSEGTLTATGSATLSVTNSAPTLNVTGADAAIAGRTYTLALSATDAGSDTITSWTINWGDGTVETVAGNPSSVTHAFANPGFTYNILAAATDEDGTFTGSDAFVSSLNSDRVYRLDGNTGALVGVLPVNALLDGPTGSAFGPDGRLYVSGYASSNVVWYDIAAGTTGVFVPTGSGGLAAANDLAFGPDGNLYVTSYDTDRVLRYDGTTGAFIDIFVNGGVDAPSALTFGPDGNLYVGGWFDGKVYKFDGYTGALLGGGAFVTLPGGFGVSALGFGSDGHLYVGDANLSDLLKYDGTTGAFMATIDSAIIPYDVVTGPDGSLYVPTLTTPGRIERFSTTTGASSGFFDTGVTGIAGAWGLAFSPDVQVTVAPEPAPVITGLSGDVLAYAEGDGARVVEQGGDAQVTDATSTDFSGGTLTVSIVSGGVPMEDGLGIRNQGSGAGQIGFSASSVSYGGTVIGSVTGGAGGSPLVVTFNGNATPVAVTALLKNITYLNANQTSPTAGSRTLRYVVTDGDGETSANHDATVTVTAVNDAPTFAPGDGKLSTTFPTSADAKSVVVQPDGKIVVVGFAGSSMVMARYNADGVLDSSFGTGGTVTTVVGSSAEAWSVALQSDGKILVAGNSYNGINTDFALVRYNSDGSLDTTFDADGKVTTAIGLGNDRAVSIALQSDGKIVLGGYSNNLLNEDFAVVRYNSDGSLDTSFNGDGRVTTAVGLLDDYVTDIAIQSDGKILLGGYSHNGLNTDFALVRYNGNGSLDTTFDGDGKVTTAIGAGNDQAESIAIQSDGKIVLGGTSHNGSNEDFALARYNSDGSLDTTFDTDGKVTTAFSTGADYGSSVAIQSDGRIVLAGRTLGSGNADFAIARYDSNGTLDSTFDSDGKQSTDFSGSGDLGRTLAIQPDGKLVMAGMTWTGAGFSFALVRYNAAGSLDTGFDSAFTDTLDGTPNFTEGGSAVVLDGNVGVFDIELSVLNSFDGATLTLVRHGGASAQDVFSASGSLGALTPGGPLTLGLNAIGTVTTNSGGTLVLTFNAGATGSLVNSAMRLIAYRNTSDAPPASVQIDWTFSDGNAGAQGSGGALTATGSTTVTIVAINDAPVDLYAVAGVAESNLTAAYTFTSPDSLGRDGAGDGAPITFYGSPGQTTGPDGSAALDLAGSASGQYGNIAGITTGGAMTIAAQVRFDSTGYWQRVVDFGQDYSGGIGAIYIGRLSNSNDLTFTLEKDLGGGVYEVYRATAAGVITNGSWMHVAATVDSAGLMSLYVNGALAASTAGVMPEVGVRTNNYIGRSNWAGDALFDGAIDDLVVASVALSASEVAALYQQNNTFTVAENAADGAVLGTVVVSDPDAGGTFTFALSDSAGGRFAIASNGTISVANGGLLDFESAQSHSITVQVTDSASATRSEAFTVNLSNVNEAPVIGSNGGGASAAVTVAEGGTAVTTVTASDVDAGTTLSYSIVGGADDARFAINSSTGVLTFVAAPDAESPRDAGVDNVYDVTVQVSDGQGLTDTQAIAVTVSGVNEAPVFVGLNATPTYTEGGSAVVLDGNVTVFDPELSAAGNFEGAVLTLSRSGGANADDALAFDGTHVTTSGANVLVGGVVVGTYGFTGGEMTLSFGAGATHARIDTLLQNIVYWNWSDAPPASVQIDWTFSDGNAGAQGSGGALAATGSTTVSITAVNDAPVLGFVTGNSNYPEGSGAVVVSGLASIVDVDSNDFDGGQIVVSFTANGQTEDRLSIRHQGSGAGQVGVSGTTLSYGGVVIGNLAGGGDGSTPLVVTFNANATVDAVQAVARNITYQNVSEAPSTLVRSLEGYVTDGDGGTSNTAAGTITVLSVNDAPAGADMTVVTVEDTAYVFSTADFGFTDIDGHVLSRVKITSLPVLGVLSLDNVAILAGDFVLAADIGAGLLRYTPPADARGAALASFTFQVQDSGGTANGGFDLDASPNTITMDVTAVNDTPSGAPVVTGTLTEDQTLTAADTSAISDADGLGAFSYRWLRDGVAVGGATTSTYVLGDADVGSKLSVEVRYTDGNGTIETLTSAQTAAVANVNDAPSGAPVVTGTGTEDQTLTADTSGISDADGLTGFTYRWLRDGVAVGGATASTYVLGDADVGSKLSVEVSYTDGNGTVETLTSAETSAVANVNDTPSGVPVVTGTATEDQTLTADTSGLADADGLGAFTYRWLRDGVAVGGATASTYVLGDADVGSKLSVEVSYTDGNGTVETLTSAETAAVANVNDTPSGVLVVTGTATEDQTLTADTSGISDADGLGAFTYRWLRDGVAVGGATASTYVLGDADVGAKLSVEVSYTDGNGTVETLTSAETSAVANVNDTPSGVLVVTGAATEDQTLTADTSGLADADGLGAFTYRWLRDGVAVGGATASTYVLGDADVGSKLSVEVSYTDGNGTVETLTSAETSAVANVNDTPSGVPVVTGTATEDQTLTADTSGISDADGLTGFSYRWLRDGVAVGGATASTYVLGDADVGSKLSVEVSYTDGNGTVETLTSAETSAVANVNDTPSAVPVVTGTGTEDQTLTADTSGLADADGLGAFTYRWLRDGVAVGGATASTYVLGDADVGSKLSVEVSYTDGNGTVETLTSAETSAVANVNDAPAGLPTITGTATEDQTLTADTSSISDADGLGAFTYRWLRDGVAVGGATASTYVLGDADVGSKLSVEVSYTDGNGTVETLTSAETSAVANVNDAPTLQNNAVRVVDEGGMALIDASLLLTTDVDNNPSGLTYAVDQPVSAGRLELAAAPGQAISHFTQADIDAGLLRYVHDGSEVFADTFTFSVTDAEGALIGSVSFLIQVTPLNDSPVVSSAAGGPFRMAAGNVPQAVDAALTLNDDDSAMLSGVVIRIDGQYMAGSDRLVLAGSHPVLATWNDADGTLTLSGAARPADYVSALRDVQFATTSTASGTRTLGIAATDGAAWSAVFGRTLILPGSSSTAIPVTPEPAAPASPATEPPVLQPDTPASTPDGPQQSAPPAEAVTPAETGKTGESASESADDSAPSAVSMVTGPLDGTPRLMGDAAGPDDSGVRSSRTAPSSSPVVSDVSALIQSVLERLQSEGNVADASWSVDAADGREGGRAFSGLPQQVRVGGLAGRSLGLLDETQEDDTRQPDDFGFDIQSNPGLTGGLILSASVLWWATRSGGLLAAMMASVPAWKSFDPLPIVSRSRSVPVHDGDDLPGADEAGWLDDVPDDGDIDAVASESSPMLEEMVGPR